MEHLAAKEADISPRSWCFVQTTTKRRVNVGHHLSCDYSPVCRCSSVSHMCTLVSVVFTVHGNLDYGMVHALICSLFILFLIIQTEEE